ncbi:MAG TPA: hypothetical protein VK588_12155, partial [Chitinophagaceae bacterium]|nr:hypothetical protein [Chitinophagaceae bacterium]
MKRPYKSSDFTHRGMKILPMSELIKPMGVPSGYWNDNYFRMKNIFLLCIVLIVLCGCYKSNKTPLPRTPPVYDILIYTESIKDSLLTISVQDSSDLSVSISFVRQTGNPDKYPISLTIDSVPAGITISQKSFSFMLNNTIQFSLHAIADTGYYTIYLKVTDSATGTKHYPLRIKVLPSFYQSFYPNCAYCLVHYWSSVGNGGATDSCVPVISLIPSLPHWVNIRNINCLGDNVSVNAYVSCDSGLTIPQQTGNGYTIYGSAKTYPCGVYYPFTIQDTIVHNGDTLACNFV